MNDLQHYMIDNGLVKYGDFTLSSGQKSNWYFDAREIYSLPDGTSRLLKAFRPFLEKNPVDLMCGIPQGGIPLATILSQIDSDHTPMLLLDKQPKPGKSAIHGKYEKGQTVRVVEDTITTGQSALKYIEWLQKAGLVVKDIVCICDRRSDPLQLLHGLKGTSTMTSFHQPKLAIHPESIKQLIREKQSGLCLSVDLSDKKEILELVNEAGPHIVMLKIHMDIVRHPDTDFYKTLSLLAVTHRFYIIEDRKLSDIGYIVEKQIDVLSQWADVVTIHSHFDSDTLQRLSAKIGLLMIDSMSNGLLQPATLLPSQKIHLTGLISQKEVSPEDNQLLCCTPGIHLEQKEDGKDQKYRTPQQALDQGYHIIIVGRGILQSENRLESLLVYKRESYASIED